MSRKPNPGSLPELSPSVPDDWDEFAELRDATGPDLRARARIWSAVATRLDPNPGPDSGLDSDSEIDGPKPSPETSSVPLSSPGSTSFAWMAKVATATAAVTVAGLAVLRLAVLAVRAVVPADSPATHEPTPEPVRAASDTLDLSDPKRAVLPFASDPESAGSADSSDPGSAGDEPGSASNDLNRAAGDDPGAAGDDPGSASNDLNRAAGDDPGSAGDSLGDDPVGSGDPGSARAGSEPGTGDSLSAELELIRAARTASSPTATLALLARHREAFPHGQLVDERELIRLEVLCALGRTGDAQHSAAVLRERGHLDDSRIDDACPTL